MDTEKPLFICTNAECSYSHGLTISIRVAAVQGGRCPRCRDRLFPSSDYAPDGKLIGDGNSCMVMDYIREHLT